MSYQTLGFGNSQGEGQAEAKIAARGAVVKLKEVANGNLDAIEDVSLEASLENHLSLFSRNCATTDLFSLSRKGE